MVASARLDRHDLSSAPRLLLAQIHGLYERPGVQSC